MKDFAVMAQPEPFGEPRLRHPRPHDIALAHVPDAFRSIDKMMYLAFEDRLKIGLHFPSRHLHPDAQRQHAAFGDRVDVRPDHLDVAVAYPVEVGRRDEFEGSGLVSTELRMDVGLADALSLECGPIGHGNGDLCDFYLASAYLQRALDHGVVGNVRNDMFVGTYSRGQYLGNVGIGDNRKPVVYGPGRGGVFIGRDLAESKDKGENAVFIVAKVRGKVAGRHAAERQRGAVGETQRVDERRNVPAKRNEPRCPAELHTLFRKLFGKLLAVCTPRHEHIKVFFLELTGD